MKISQNLYAETFLKTLGAAAGTSDGRRRARTIGAVGPPGLGRPAGRD